VEATIETEVILDVPGGQQLKYRVYNKVYIVKKKPQAMSLLLFLVVDNKNK
jgi:hypothetical protein